MLKADAALFTDLASADEAVQLAAATKLEGRRPWYFNDQHPETFSYTTEQVGALIGNWEAARHDSVKAWIAQALALSHGMHTAALPLQAASLHLDGPYMSRVANTVYRWREYLPGSDAILRALHDHPDKGIREYCARALEAFARGKQLIDGDLALARRLMLDESASVRQRAVQALACMPELGLVEYEALLDVENIDSGNARFLARELMAKLETTVPGCNKAAFKPREPLLHSDGLYQTERHELDATGRWISTACLHFLPDGTVRFFGTDEAPALFQKAVLPGPGRTVAQGTVSRQGKKHITLFCESAEGRWDFEGYIDGSTLHLQSTHRESGRSLQEAYMYWGTMPKSTAPVSPSTRKPKAAKPPPPFIPLRPRSLIIADASKWYLQIIARLPKMLEDTPEGPQRLARAWDIKHQLRAAAVRSFFDPTLKNEFYAKMPLPALETLQTLDLEEALKQLLTVTLAEVRAFPGTLGEMIGARTWDGKNTWEMTEQGWVLIAKNNNLTTRGAFQTSPAAQ